MITILIIDHDTQFVHTLQRRLSSQRDMAVVGVAATARTGLELVEQVRPTVVFVDAYLTDRDGVDLAAEIARQARAPGIIMTADYANTVLMRRAMQAGAQHFIDKAKPLPYNLSTMIYKIVDTNRLLTESDGIALASVEPESVTRDDDGTEPEISEAGDGVADDLTKTEAQPLELEEKIPTEGQSSAELELDEEIFVEEFSFEEHDDPFPEQPPSLEEKVAPPPAETPTETDESEIEFTDLLAENTQEMLGLEAEEPLSDADMPDWVQDATKKATGTLPDWFDAAGDESDDDADLPDWLFDDAGAAADTMAGDVPDWLIDDVDATPGDSIDDVVASAAPPPPPAPAPQPSAADTHDVAERSRQPGGDEPVRDPASLTMAGHSSFGNIDEMVRTAQSVHFSAYYPREVKPDDWQPLIAYVYRQMVEEKINDDAQKQLGEKFGAFRRIAQIASREIREGAPIVATPHLPGFQFNPPSVLVYFYEDWHRFDFKLRATEATPFQAANGFITFTVESVIVGDIPLSIFVSDESASAEIVSVQTHLYEAIFASYSHDDTHIVERVEAAYKALGLDYLRDVTTLKAGQHWDDELLEMIDRADIFQLFWSPTAATSPYVRKEWEYALKLDRDDTAFIRPVYWTRPIPPVPPEMSHIHFAYRPELGA